MKNLHTIYCQVGFIEKFTKKYKESFPKVEELEVSADFAILQKLYKLLLKDSVLKLNIKPNELIKLSKKNIVIKSILKKEMAQDTLKFVPEEHEKIKTESSFFNDKVSEIFMLDLPEDKCQEIENNYGLMALSANNFKAIQFLFQSDLISISTKNRNINSWDFIKKYRHPSNSMILADNYLFADIKKKTDNLLPFLKNILPKKLRHRKYQLLILTADAKGTKHPININQTQNQIKTELKKHFPYSFDIQIIKYKEKNESGREIHDRNFITNYLWLNSGFGFNLFNKKQVKKDTHISVYPNTYKSNEWYNYQSKKMENSTVNSVLNLRTNLLNQFKTILYKLEKKHKKKYSNNLLN